MPVSDLDIHRAAYQWIAQHGDNATAKARQMVELMRQKGDTEVVDTWLRIHHRHRDARSTANKHEPLS